MPSPPPYAEFDFDVARAVIEQLIEAFDELSIGALADPVLARVQPKPGVYQLYMSKRLVYVGKADKDLKGRLGRHRRALSGRRNIRIDQVGFKCLYIHRNWSTWTSEEKLLEHYGADCAWNNSGFGSNDPGRKRDHTAEPPTTFNSRYPIDLDCVCEWLRPGSMTAYELLNEAKENLPYLLRFETTQQAESEMRRANVPIPQRGLTTRQLIKEIVRQLPPIWQATALPGRLILYRERASYEHGEIIRP